MRNLFILLLAGIFVVSCSKDEDNTPDPTPTPSNADRVFTVSNSGASAYVFGFTNVQNPELELVRGKTYDFNVTSPGHPFLIKSDMLTGTNNMFNDGVTNNGTGNGTITFTVPDNAPDILWYVCEFHTPMIGRMRIVDEGETRSFVVGNNGPTAYTFSGNGISDLENANFTFKRGETYVFTINTPGHPFLIKTSEGTGTGNTFNDGVTNNGIAEGELTFIVPQNAPNTLFYACEFHSSMTGSISIAD